MKYPKTIRAAKGVSTDEKALAAAILVEVPPARRGGKPDRGSPVETALTEMSAELAAEGYVYSPATLGDYREIAAWASKDPGSGAIAWQSVAWNTHVEAYQGGMTWRSFVTNVENGKIKTGDDVRRILGKRTSRKAYPSEKAREVSDLAATGQLSDDDARSLAASLPSDVIEAEAHERRSTRISDNRDNVSREAGMSPEEIANADRVMDALRGAVADFDNATKDIVKNWWQKHLIDARGSLVSALHAMRSEDLDAEGVRDFGKEIVVEIKDIVGLLEMKISGNDLPSQVEDWLRDQAQA